MDAIDAILSRRSRKRFTEKPVPYEVLAEILNAGNHAPSAGNLQNWKFLVISDSKIRKQMPELCSGQEWAAAPISIIVVSEPRIAKEYFPKQAEYFSTQNCAAAMQNMLIAANHFNLGAVWIGSFNEEKLKSLLGIGEEKIEGILSMGYSLEIPIAKNFKELRGQVYFNSWGNNKNSISPEEKDYSGLYENFAQHAKTGFVKIKEKFMKK